MDNAKQFAYYPVAVLKSVNSFSNGTISVKFKTVAGDSDRASGHPLQRQAERRLAGGSLQRHREQRRAVGVPQRHPPQRCKFSDRAKPFMLDRAAWHELKLTSRAPSLKAWLDGAARPRVHARQRAGPGPQRRAAEPGPVPREQPRAASAGRGPRSVCGRRPTAPAISRTTSSAPK